MKILWLSKSIFVFLTTDNVTEFRREGVCVRVCVKYYASYRIL